MPCRDAPVAHELGDERTEEPFELDASPYAVEVGSQSVRDLGGRGG